MSASLDHYEVIYDGFHEIGFFFDNLFLNVKQYFASVYKKNKDLKDYFHGVV